MPNFNIDTQRYELSLWTHKDELITMLKTNTPFNGEAYDVILKTFVSGDSELTFTIPLYIFSEKENKLIKNPVWGYIINEQKIRLIKDKKTSNEKVFDFIIKNFVRERQGELKTATITCKSLALYELNKVGFSIVFNEETLVQENNSISKATISFWLDKTLPYTNNKYSITNTSGWTYEVPTLYEKQNIIGYGEKYDSQTLSTLWKPKYQTSVSPFFSFDENDPNIVKIEKERIITISKSNVFNVLQELAEKFQVWVFIEYTYNEVYQITGRKIKFKEETLTDGKYVFSYGTNINTISQTDNTDDIVTKMYVTSVESEYEDDSLMNIDDAPQNLMQETFLYNFDYYKNAGLMNDYQYADLLIAQSAIRNINMKIKPLQAMLYNKNTELQQLIAKQEFASFQKIASQNTADSVHEQLVTCQTGTVQLNEQYYVVKQSGSDFIIDLSYKKGIIYNSFSDFKNSLKNAINPTYSIIYDIEDPSLVIGLNFGTNNPDTSGKSRIYVSFSIDTEAYLTKLYLNYLSQTESFEALNNRLLNQIASYNTQITNLTKSINNGLVIKKNIISSIEYELSSMVKEGEWQDSDYALKKTSNTLTNISVGGTTITKNCYFISDTDSTMDLDSIQLWIINNGVFTTKYCRYSDYNLQYGSYNGTRGILFIPVDGRPFVNETSTIYCQYKIINTDVILSININKVNCNLWNRTLTLTDANIIHSSIQIFPTDNSAALIEGTDYILHTEYQGENLITTLQLQPTQNALHLNYYAKILYNTNISNQYFYYDAVDVSNRSAYPNISFSIGVIDLSCIEGFEDFYPEVGQTINIVDYEMFPTQNPPFGLRGFVSEVDYYLDHPESTSITIANYKTKFEDIFQRIVAATQSVQNNENTIETISQIISPNKTINFDVLQNSLYSNYLTLSTGTQNSVVWGTDGITITDIGQNSTVPPQIKIVGQGIFASYKNNENGTREWTTAITGRGINATAITTGRLDTKLINIWNSSQVRFIWNEDGLFSFNETSDGATDYNTFVRLNQDGLLFQRLLNPGSDDEYLDTPLSLTWNGLYLSGQRGSIQLGSEKGLQVFDNQLIPKERIQIGRLFNGEAAENLFGLRIKDQNGQTVLETTSEGILSLLRTMTIGSLSNTVGITGDLMSMADFEIIYADIIANPPEGETKEQLYNNLIVAGGKSIRIWGGNSTNYLAPFILYQNGDLVVRNADIKGKIEATSGSFTGNVYAYDGFFNGVINAKGGTFSGPVYTSSDQSSGISNGTYKFWSGPTGSTAETSNFSVNDSGVLKATNANITGVISATSGNFLGEMLIGSGVSGIDGTYNVDIPFWIQGDGNTRASSQFYIDKTGTVYTKNIHLTNSAYIEGNTYFGNGKGGFFGGATLSEENEVRFWINPLVDKTDALFRIYGNGDVVATNLTLNNNGSLKANNAILTGNLLMDGIIIQGGNNSFIGSDFYIPKTLGWKIKENGSADFNNVDIRGRLQSTVFEYNSLSALGGDLYVSPSFNTTKDFELNTVLGDTPLLNFTFTFNTTDIPLVASLWNSNSELKIQGFIKGNGINDKPIAINNIKTSTFNYNDITETYIMTFEVVDETLYGYTAPFTLISGTTIVNVKSGLNNRFIHLTAQDVNGPYIDIQGPNYDLTKVNITRLGNLTGIESEYFGSIDEYGYGLYAENAYLVGRLYLPNAGITNEENVLKDGSPIRMWAGSTALERENAPFIVTQDGALYAKKGVFSGTVEATNSTFSGYLISTAIVVDDGNPENTGIPNQFYVAYDKFDNNGDLITTNDNLILKINNQGLSVFDGGLRVFSDWADSQTSHYGTEDTDFPYVQTIDDGMRMAIKTGHFIDIKNSFEYNSTIIEGNLIRFNSKTSGQSDTFLNLEKDAYDYISQGLINLDQNKNLVIAASSMDTKNGIIVFNSFSGESGVNDRYTTFTNKVKVGINTNNPINELDVVGVIGASEEIDIGNVKIIKILNAEKTAQIGIDLVI